MPLTDPALWQMIRDRPLPMLPARPPLWGKPGEAQDFERGLGDDLILMGGTARGLVRAYRQWLYLCVVEGRRLQASDIITKVELLHREAAEDWQALTSGVLQGVLDEVASRRGPDNDAAYAETLRVHDRESPDGGKDSRFWPMVWRCRVERWRLGRVFAVSCLFIALWMLGSEVRDVPEAIRVVLGWGAGAGGVGAFCALLLLRWAVPFQNDDSGY